MTGTVSEEILTFCKIFFVKRLTNIKLRVIIYKHSGERTEYRGVEQG